MAFDQNKRLKPAVLKADVDALAAIKGLVPPYAPADIKYVAADLTAKQTAMTTAQGVEKVKDGEFKGARDSANAAKWAFHNIILGAKDQVVAQYGEDSDQVQAVGLKKKSERKRPGPRTPKPPTP